MTFARKIWVALTFISSGVAGLWWSLEMHPQPILVTQARETFHSPATFVHQIDGDKEAGRKIFHVFCASCHARVPQIEVDAPRIGDRAVWSIRRRMGKKSLLAMTLNGNGAMPARGGCFECSDSQIMQAIDYILKNSE